MTSIFPKVKMLSLKNKYHGRLQQIGRKESDWRD